MSEVQNESELLYKYGVNFTASMTLIVFKLRIFNYYFVFLNRQIHLKTQRLLTV